LRILFTTGRAFLPQNSGGVQSSTMQLAEALLERGHEVGVICKLNGGDWTAIRSRLTRRLRRSRFSCDRSVGLPVYRAWDPTDTREVVERFKPDVAVVQSGHTMDIANSLQAQGVPVVIYYRNVEFDELNGNPSTLRNARHIANSTFTARMYSRQFGIEPTVIPPLVDKVRYLTTTSRENVTFINPYVEKGRDIAFAIAERCPDIPFHVYESWEINDKLQAWLKVRLARLDNVTLHKRTSDMRTVYGKAKILLAPSVWEEAWGRVATEAQFSGIPVLGSDRGGLPEAIGPGGTVLSIDAPVEAWVAELRRLWDDDDYYAVKSRQALGHAARAEINPAHQLGMLENVLKSACEAVAANSPG